jgi:membrane protease YdiL (CAAX protease family)
MDYRRANRTYLYMILVTIGLVIVISLWYLVGGPTLSILMNNVLSEGVVLIPAIAAVLYSGEKLSTLIPIKKIKVSSVLLILLYVITLFPLVSLVNYVSMLFVENTVTSIADQLLDMPMWVMILSIGIFGPFVEEIVFRGVILQSYQRTGRIIGSIVISSVMFGMIHMNFNQFGYGTVMGIMLALLVEATGSVLASFIAHAFFNSMEVVMMYANKDVIEDASSIAESYFEGLSDTMVDAIYIGYLVVMSIIFTAIAVFIVRKIAKNEQRLEFFEGIKTAREQGYKLITLPLILAMVIAVVYMIYTIQLV